MNKEVKIELPPKELFSLMCLEKRLETFKNWPFNGNDCACTAQKMADAGFYHCPTDQEPDAVQCAVCLKELDGWEPDDDPRAEHRNHSKDCPYLRHADPAEMTVEEVLSLFSYSCKARVKKYYQTQLEELEKFEAEAFQQLTKLL